MPANPLPDTPRLTIVWDVADELATRVDAAFVERVLTEALANRKPGGPLEIGLTITTDEGIRDLNRRYRGFDSATDVLSFPMIDFERPEQPSSVFPTPPGEPLSLGDIVVSYPRSLEQAQRYGHSLERELAFLLVHGAMHLLGYDHDNPRDQTEMRKQEESVLAKLGLAGQEGMEGREG